jgi:DNA-binding response OmpR family regulator
MGQTGRNRVLVIDDDTTFANLLTIRLESVGYEVEITTDGTTALQAATERHPDLVILDLRLPDMSGFDVCKELRRIFHPWEVPILMLSDVDQPIAQLRGFACGADAYLTKPFDSTELFKTVALLLGQFELTS